MPLPKELSFEERVELRLQYVEAGVRELRGRQIRLEEAWKEFVPAVTKQITNEVIIPGLVTGLMNTLKLPTRLESDWSRGDVAEEILRERGKGRDG